MRRDYGKPVRIPWIVSSIQRRRVPRQVFSPHPGDGAPHAGSGRSAGRWRSGDVLLRGRRGGPVKRIPLLAPSRTRRVPQCPAGILDCAKRGGWLAAADPVIAQRSAARPFCADWVCVSQSEGLAAHIQQKIGGCAVNHWEYLVRQRPDLADNIAIDLEGGKMLQQAFGVQVGYAYEAGDASIVKMHPIIGIDIDNRGINIKRAHAAGYRYALSCRGCGEKRGQRQGASSHVSCP